MTLGTVWNREVGLVRTLVRALDGHGLRVLVTAGPGVPPSAFETCSGRVGVSSYLRQDLVLPRVRAVLSHGGFHTVLPALAAGVPVAVVPLSMDHPLTAQRCVRAGVGTVLCTSPPEQPLPTATPSAVTEDAVLEAVLPLLHEPRLLTPQPILRARFPVSRTLTARRDWWSRCCDRSGLRHRRRTVRDDSLWLWLLRHRELGMIARKEAHFFDDERRDWTSPDYTDLHAMIPQDRRYGGDATPITLYWTPAHARLHAYNPRCRIVLLFRDPVDRAASQWAMRTQKGVEDLPFARAVREGRARTGEVVEVEGLSRGLSYLERGRYGEQLGRLLELFPRDQVLCLDLAGFARGREADLLRTVTDFLGVEPDGFGSYDRVHLMASTVTPVIDPATRELLAEEFAPDLRLFAGLSGLDLSAWPTARAAGL